MFIERLGAEVLGLNTTATNLLSFLNLAELGIGAAVSFSLYGPLAEDNREAVNGIVSVQGWLYRRIAWIVIGAATVLVCFFPLLFEKAAVPLWYAYATFGVLLFGSLSGYFFNYRQIVVTADQRNYRLLMVTESIKNGKVLLQIAAIVMLPGGYVWWLVLEFLASAATIFGINALLKRRYPWLETNVRAGGRLRSRYPQIVTKTKQVFFHKMGGFVLLQASPLVVYAFTSLTTVAIYGNYMFIVLGINAMLNALLNSLIAGVGNMLTTAEPEKTVRFLGELFSFRFLVACVACMGMWLLAPGFVELWVGREYLLDNTSLALMTAILYVTITRGAVDTFIYASGLYQDVWAPIIEAAINLGASIVLGRMFGLQGILAGVVLSLLIVVKGWKPYFFFSRYLHKPLRLYAAMYARHLAALAITLALFVPLFMAADAPAPTSWLGLVIYGTVVCGGFGILLSVILYMFDRGMRDCAARVMLILKPKR